jgi:hypothetical protein
VEIDVLAISRDCTSNRTRHLYSSSYADENNVALLQAEAFVRIIREGSGTWLADLLEWISIQGIENLSPCLVASKAAGMQGAWNKARATKPSRLETAGLSCPESTRGSTPQSDGVAGQFGSSPARRNCIIANK